MAAGGARTRQPSLEGSGYLGPVPALEVGGLGSDAGDGKPLPNDNMPASVVLPLGQFGPTFMAYDNFQAYLK